MRAGRGFTLIETIMAGGIILVSLAAWLYYWKNFASVDKRQSADQEYHNQLARLESHLRQDLRNCVEFDGQSPGEYSLRIPIAAEGQPLVFRSVTYRRTADGKQVERVEDGRKETYDFSRFLGKKALVFRLSP